MRGFQRYKVYLIFGLILLGICSSFNKSEDEIQTNNLPISQREYVETSKIYDPYFSKEYTHEERNEYLVKHFSNFTDWRGKMHKSFCPNGALYVSLTFDGGKLETGHYSYGCPNSNFIKPGEIVFQKILGIKNEDIVSFDGSVIGSDWNRTGYHDVVKIIDIRAIKGQLNGK